jgi:hypothetical protein
VVYTALKLFPVYMEAFTVESAVSSLETDKNEEFSGPSAVRSALIKRFSINNVTAVPMDDISVTREDQVYMVDVDYEVRIPFIKNINLIVSFENHAEVSARLHPLSSGFVTSWITVSRSPSCCNGRCAIAVLAVTIMNGWSFSATPSSVT